MYQLRKLAAFIFVITISLSVQADCNDIRSNCQREFDLDNAYCNNQPSQSQQNCFARSHERFQSCMSSCR
jgi:hypothetical protein